MTIDLAQLSSDIKLWGQELGFQSVGISPIDLSGHSQALQQWLANGYHGSMEYMSRHADLRTNPDRLHPGTMRVISVRMNYLPPHAQFASTLKRPEVGYISRYALGRDYHKLMRKRLKQLADRITEVCTDFDGRPFVDSAPILERPLAANAGLGWQGKHSLIIDQSAGSWFFLGEILTNLPLPTDNKVDEQCGKCVACITICPTGAIVDDGVIDARRCISYLTIEHDGPIPKKLRPLMGNRIYGCDDCQLVCPWNRHSDLTGEDDFHPRHGLEQRLLLELLAWDEPTFLKKTEGSAIRRIGYQRWQRNITVALGNAPHDPAIVAALREKQVEHQTDAMLTEQIQWSIEQQLEDVANKKTARLIRVIEKGLPRDA